MSCRIFSEHGAKDWECFFLISHLLSELPFETLNTLSDRPRFFCERPEIIPGRYALISKTIEPPSSKPLARRRTVSGPTLSLICPNTPPVCPVHRIVLPVESAPYSNIFDIYDSTSGCLRWNSHNCQLERADGEAAADGCCILLRYSAGTVRSASIPPIF